jgi:hypothetical protein
MIHLTEENIEGFERVAFSRILLIACKFAKNG